MAVDISALDRLMPDAVRHFWRARTIAAGKQRKRGTSDQGSRSSVTAGKNLDGVVAMVRQVIVENGIDDAEIYTGRSRDLSIPGFYRPTKNWDLLVVRRGRLVAAVEFKSQVGPSFGNNFNNRVEEALGNAADLKMAFSQGAFPQNGKPFMGFFFLLEECEKSTTPVSLSSPHFSTFPEFENTSYAARYEILCRKLVQEQLYDAAAVVLTSENDVKTGDFRTASEMTTPRRFVAALAGYVAGVAAE